MNKDILKKELRNKLQKFIDQTKIYTYVIINGQNNYSIQLANKYTKDTLLIHITNKNISLVLGNEYNNNTYNLKCSINEKGIKLYNFWLNEILKTF